MFGSSSIEKRRRKRADARDARVVADLEQRALRLVRSLELGCCRSAASAYIVRNLNISNVRSPRPMRGSR